jgi:transcription elongation factor Elf1
MNKQEKFIINEPTKISNQIPVNCPICGAIQTKRGFLVTTFKHAEIFTFTCWKCGAECIVTQEWKVLTLD